MTIETLRDLHDETGVPIILVGMQLAKHKLKKHTHLFDRISEIYKFSEFEYSDIKQITEEILNQIIKHFQNEGYIDKTCIFEVKRIADIPKRQIQILTQEQLAQLFTITNKNICTLLRLFKT